MKPGDSVTKGQLLMTVEGMKMEVRGHNISGGCAWYSVRAVGTGSPIDKVSF